MKYQNLWNCAHLLLKKSMEAERISLFKMEQMLDNGIDLTLFKSNRLRFNLSGDLGVPVNSSDSEARAGMPDLDLVLQLGPSLEYTLAGGRFEPSHTRFELPLRAAIATDLGSVDSVGWMPPHDDPTDESAVIESMRNRFAI